MLPANRQWREVYTEFNENMSVSVGRCVSESEILPKVNKYQFGSVWSIGKQIME
jgi:hypothetical protein